MISLYFQLDKQREKFELKLETTHFKLKLKLKRVEYILAVQ